MDFLAWTGEGIEVPSFACLFLTRQSGRSLADPKKSRPVRRRLLLRPNEGRDLLVFSQNGDDAAHGSSVVAVGILNAAVRAGSLGLVVRI